MSGPFIPVRSNCCNPLAISVEANFDAAKVMPELERPKLMRGLSV